jgi:hypothetical protein
MALRRGQAGRKTCVENSPLPALGSQMLSAVHYSFASWSLDSAPPLILLLSHGNVVDYEKLTSTLLTGESTHVNRVKPTRNLSLLMAVRAGDHEASMPQGRSADLPYEISNSRTNWLPSCRTNTGYNFTECRNVSEWQPAIQPIVIHTYVESSWAVNVR